MQKNILNSMRKYWLNNLRTAGATLLIALMATGCTKTDDTTGNNGFIPDGGDYKMYQNVISEGFEISTVRVDSISSDNFTVKTTSSTAPVLYLGSQVTKREGQINYSIITQGAPEYAHLLKDGSEPFGKNPQIDSAYFSLYIYGAMGETDRRYTVSVYELKKALPYPMDSVYYSNFDATGYYDENAPIFSIDTKLGEHIYQKIPLEYAKKFMALSGEQYKSTEKFHEFFKGYFIKTTLTQNGNMLNIISPEQSGLDIFYHNKSEKPDTSALSISFRRLTDADMWTGQQYYVNESFNMISRDYSLKDPVFGVNFENKVVSDITYVSGMAGLITKLEIKESVIEQIKELVKSKGGKRILVTNATLVIECGDVTIDGLNSAITSLGGYKQYQPINNVSSTLYSRDIFYMLDDYSGLYKTLTSFDGILNRGTKEYRLNISSTIQALINGKNSDRIIEIAPGYSEKESTNVAVLENSASKPIKLELTYSVVQ